MKVKDIMAKNIICISHKASLKDAHELMQTRGVRHLPVISENDGTLVGILTHKKMISTIISMVTKYGTEILARKERGQLIEDLMDTDFQKITEDEPLKVVVEYFIDNKLGCLPVIDSQNKVTGIVTSSDFVKLCAQLLSH
ncbi:CBS domain-containing protein [Moritella sp. 24]|uniref:CBS domain-containing protein n=1 Tax=Moritella sp. 24 TaxID=2746230 RepID=UPI001BA8F855|nr:CBS domain-containing protein [Moritella sp. 24]QUM76758.1 CBS domain-containing protein [Moritella sp. 24]